MTNKRKVAEQLLDIREKVRMLEENPDEQTIMELQKLIQESKTITYQYRLWDAAKVKLEQAYEKLNEAEDLAIDYCLNYKKATASDPRLVFDTFLEGIKKMFT